MDSDLGYLINLILASNSGEQIGGLYSLIFSWEYIGNDWATTSDMSATGDEGVGGLLTCSQRLLWWGCFEAWWESPEWSYCTCLCCWFHLLNSDGKYFLYLLPFFYHLSSGSHPCNFNEEAPSCSLADSWSTHGYARISALFRWLCHVTSPLWDLNHSLDDDKLELFNTKTYTMENRASPNNEQTANKPSIIRRSVQLLRNADNWDLANMLTSVINVEWERYYLSLRMWLFNIFWQMSSVDPLRWGNSMLQLPIRPRRLQL
jgi:hypothetical protein